MNKEAYENSQKFRSNNPKAVEAKKNAIRRRLSDINKNKEVKNASRGK